RNLKFEYTGTATSSMTVIYNVYGTNLRLIKCTVQMPAVSGANYCIQSLYNINTLYDSNTVRGGYYGIYEYGQTTSPYNAYYANACTNNRITLMYYYGIYSTYGYQNRYIGNYLDSAGNGSGMGLALAYDGGATAEKNVIPAYGMYYPLYLYSCNFYNSTASSLIDNN